MCSLPVSSGLYGLRAAQSLLICVVF